MSQQICGLLESLKHKHEDQRTGGGGRKGGVRQEPLFVTKLRLSDFHLGILSHQPIWGLGGHLNAPDTQMDLSIGLQLGRP